MKIIDTHVHIGGENVGFHMTEDMVWKLMEQENINYSIISNGDCAELDHQQKMLREQISQEEALLRSLNFAKEHAGRIGVAAWVKPNVQGMTKELRQLIVENREWMKAVKLHPYHSNIRPTDPLVLPYLEMAEELGLPVVSHTGGCEAAHPRYLCEAAKLFPEIPFVMVHMGLGTDNKEAIDLLEKVDNLYGDTTWVPMDTTLEVIRRYGEERMVWGTDSPIDGVNTYRCNGAGQASMYREYFEKMPELVSIEAYEKLMHINAERIFSIH